VTNNTTLTLNIGDAKFNYTIKKIVSKPLFIEKNLFLAHKENDYIDFDFEGLI
jgi:hypothetical protein